MQAIAVGDMPDIKYSHFWPSNKNNQVDISCLAY